MNGNYCKSSFSFRYVPKMPTLNAEPLLFHALVKMVIMDDSLSNSLSLAVQHFAMCIKNKTSENVFSFLHCLRCEELYYFLQFQYYQLIL